MLNDWQPQQSAARRRSLPVDFSLLLRLLLLLLQLSRVKGGYGEAPTTNYIFDHHHHHHSDGHADHHGGCGAHAPSVSQEQRQQLRVDTYMEHDRRRHRNRQLVDGSMGDTSSSTCQICRGCIEVPIQLHLVVLQGNIVPHPTEAVSSLLTGKLRNPRGVLSSPEDIAVLFRDNVRVLNQVYQDTTPFYFTWNGTYDTIEHNAATFAAVEHRTLLGERVRRRRHEKTQSMTFNTTDMNATLSTNNDENDESEEDINDDDSTTLHVYVAFSLLPALDQQGILFGFSTFPAAQVSVGDGVYLRYDVLTGGGRRDNSWDAGYWLAHETGHWLGEEFVYAPRS